MTSNVTPLRTETEIIRARRAAYVRHEVEADGRSVRYVAGKIGVSHSSLGDRLRGKVAFLAEDIEEIAGILKRDPVEFYAAYLAAGHNPTPDESDPRDSEWYLAPVTPIRRPA